MFEPNSVCPSPSRKYVIPSVAISSVTASWFTRWRSTSRSISQATTPMHAAASKNAIVLAIQRLSMPIHIGTHSAKRAIASAANSTIAPCAKLNTPEALKISTKPRATREYNMPAIRPPSSASRKKAIAASPPQWLVPR
eukprot:44294-Eustigmatos_ZCMA.PRE.1